MRPITQDDLWKIIKRSQELADMPIQRLRRMVAGYHCSEESSDSDIKNRGFHRMTKGELVEQNLAYEFDDLLSED